MTRLKFYDINGEFVDCGINDFYRLTLDNIPKSDFYKSISLSEKNHEDNEVYFLNDVYFNDIYDRIALKLNFGPPMFMIPCEIIKKIEITIIQSGYWLYLYISNSKFEGKVRIKFNKENDFGILKSLFKD